MWIYLITCLANDKYYVGQHKGNNLQRYLVSKFNDAAKKPTCKCHLYNAIRKYGRTAFIIEPLVKAGSKDELNRLETLWIVLSNAMDKRVGMNLTFGGEGTWGYSPTPEAIEKVRIANTGRKFSEDTKERLSVSHRGEKSGGHKLTTAEVKNIRSRLVVGGSRGLLAKQFGVSLSTIQSIRAGKTWIDTAMVIADARTAPFSSEHREGISEGLSKSWAIRLAAGWQAPPRTPEQCAAISKRLKGVKKSVEHVAHMKCHDNNKAIVTCPTCGKTGQYVNMKRWHFENCGKERKLYTCPHCGASKALPGVMRHHFDNCKQWSD